MKPDPRCRLCGQPLPQEYERVQDGRALVVLVPLALSRRVERACDRARVTVRAFLAGAIRDAIDAGYVPCRRRWGQRGIVPVDYGQTATRGAKGERVPAPLPGRRPSSPGGRR